MKLKMRFPKILISRTLERVISLLIINFMVWYAFFHIVPPILGSSLSSEGSNNGMRSPNLPRTEVLTASGSLPTYAYNERVPSEIIEQEIIKQSIDFGLSPTFMVELAICESTLNNLATNDNSSATGVYQYIWSTWKTTESWKQKHIARTDYKANIREAMIDISNGEFHHWVECLK